METQDSELQIRRVGRRESEIRPRLLHITLYYVAAPTWTKQPRQVGRFLVDVANRHVIPHCRSCSMVPTAVNFTFVFSNLPLFCLIDVAFVFVSTAAKTKASAKQRKAQCAFVFTCLCFSIRFHRELAFVFEVAFA